MDASERGALMLVRVVVVALICWAVVDLALYVAICRHQQLPVKFFPCFIRGLPLLAGLALLLKAKSVARWVAEKMEE
jgi:ABC-type arginine/histidine transport system permease subunit